MSKAKKKKPPSLPSLKIKAWAIFSRVFRQMYADHRGFVTCVTCGKQAHWKDRMQAGHFIPKKAGILVYFDCRNVHVQCADCNCAASFSNSRAELVKIRYTLWMENMYGKEEVERLERLSHQNGKMGRADMMDLIEHLKQCENELQA
jgi:hypothetical protein